MNQYFENYIKSIFQIENDIRFWKDFLSISIKKYKIENPQNRWIFESGFTMYDIPFDATASGLLKMSNDRFSVEIKDLEHHSNNFFIWIMNLSIIRAYNSVELLLVQAIQFQYFPSLENPLNGKKQLQKVLKEITEELKQNGFKVNKKNNKYLILFLKNKSHHLNSFFLKPIWQDKKVNWEQFYELFSILRNIITHHGMLITPYTKNEIYYIGKDIFIQYFEEQEKNNESESQILKPKSDSYFLNFINLVNDFAGNTVKFIATKSDLSFIGLY